jgi:hypothetical protein
VKRFLIACCLILSFFTGCERKPAEADQKARLELQEKARLESEAANKAMTEMNRKMFRPRTTGVDGKATEPSSKGMP